MRTLIAIWNLDFTKDRRRNTLRFLSRQSCFNPKGRGNRAWKRASNLRNQPGVIIWPDYAV